MNRQTLLLALAESADGLGFNALVRALNKRGGGGRSTISRNLRALEAEGLVEHHRVSRGRRGRYRLTGQPVYKIMKELRRYGLMRRPRKNDSTLLPAIIRMGKIQNRLWKDGYALELLRKNPKWLLDLPAFQGLGTMNSILHLELRLRFLQRKLEGETMPVRVIRGRIVAEKPRVYLPYHQPPGDNAKAALRYEKRKDEILHRAMKKRMPKWLLSALTKIIRDNIHAAEQLTTHELWTRMGKVPNIYALEVILFEMKSQGTLTQNPDGEWELVAR